MTSKTTDRAKTVRKIYKRANKAKKNRLTDEALDYINKRYQLQAEYGMKVVTNLYNISADTNVNNEVEGKGEVDNKANSKNREGRLIGAEVNANSSRIYVMFLDNNGNVSYEFKHPWDVDYYLLNGKVIHSRDIMNEQYTMFNDLLKDLNNSK